MVCLHFPECPGGTGSVGSMGGVGGVAGLVSMNSCLDRLVFRHLNNFLTCHGFTDVIVIVVVVVVMATVLQNYPLLHLWSTLKSHLMNILTSWFGYLLYLLRYM